VRPVLRLCPALAVLAAAVTLTGCGDDDSDGGGGGQAAKPRTVAVKLSGSGKNVKMTAPKSLQGGVVRLQFTNEAEGRHGLQLGYVDEGHTAQDGLAAAAAWGEKGKPMPEWIHLQGGVGSIEAGTTKSVTQELPAGRYFFVDIDSNAVAYVDVTGGGGELPSPPATIEAAEYKFEASGLQAGRNRVLMENVGSEPHIVVGVRIKPGKTIEDVREFVRTEKGEDPILEEGGFDTAIMDGGVKQTVEVEAQSGTYALLCFVPDRKGGPPHSVKGMVSEATFR
jgi:hypothetical protein